MPKQIAKLKFTQILIIGGALLALAGLLLWLPTTNLATTNILQSLATQVASDLGFSSSPTKITTKTTTKSKTGQVEKVTVNRIVDGDTIELTDGRKIRYLNMDTPETVKPNTPVMCYGMDAKAYNKKAVDQKIIWLNFDKDPTDRYGRTLAFIYLDEENANSNNVTQSLNADMVKKGYSRAISYSPNTTYKKDFESWMVTAREDKKGAWEACPRPFEE